MKDKEHYALENPVSSKKKKDKALKYYFHFLGHGSLHPLSSSGSQLPSCAPQQREVWVKRRQLRTDTRSSVCLPGRREEGQAAPGSPASALGFSALHLCVCTRGPFNLALESPNLGGTQQTWGFPGGTDGKESACNAGYPSSTLGLVRKIPWRREWLPTPAFLPRESHGRGGPGGLQRVTKSQWTAKTFTFTFNRPEYQSQSCHLSAGWAWATKPSSLGLGLLVYEMSMVAASISQSLRY